MNLNIISAINESYTNNTKKTTKSLNSLSSGLRINKASDDASGIAIADKLRTHASGIKQSIANANSGIAMLNIADKAMDELSNILDIIKTKSIQMATDTTSEEGRKIIKTEILKLIDNYDSIVKQTNYNNMPLLTGELSPFHFHVGNKESDIVSAQIESTASINMGNDDPYKLKNFITGFDTLPDSNFENNSFDNGSAGWITANTPVQAGITNIAGFTMPNDPTYPSNTIGGTDTTGTMSYSSTFSNGQASLSSNGTSNNGYDVIRGPYLVSQDAVSISQGATVSVKWNAQGSSDAYDVFGYLLNVNTGQTQTILNETGNGSITQTSNISINTAGDYKFVFVAGTYDASGGKALGAQLNIEEVNILNNDLGLTRNDTNPNLRTQAKMLMDVVDTSLNQLNSIRSDVGSSTNQLESTTRNLMTDYVNTKNAESIIRDVDYAQESANFSKLNVMSQGGSFAQAKGNETQQRVLELLKN